LLKTVKTLALVLLLASGALAETCTFQLYERLSLKGESVGAALTSVRVGQTFSLLAVLDPACEKHGSAHEATFLIYTNNALRKWFEVTDAKHAGRFWVGARLKEPGTYTICLVNSQFGQARPMTPPADAVASVTLTVTP